MVGKHLKFPTDTYAKKTNADSMILHHCSIIQHPNTRGLCHSALLWSQVLTVLMSLYSSISHFISKLKYLRVGQFILKISSLCVNIILECCMTLSNFGDNHRLYGNTPNLFLHVFIQLLNCVEAGLEPPVLLAPLEENILQLAHLLLVFLVTYTNTYIHNDHCNHTND